MHQEKAPPLLTDLRTQILAAQQKILRKSPAGKAASYTLALWDKLTIFLEYPVLELSNNLARKNWVPLGSKEAGPIVPAIFSIVESCRELGLPIRPYLVAVLSELANRPIQSLDQLPPAAYATRRQINLASHPRPRQPCTWPDGCGSPTREGCHALRRHNALCTVPPSQRCEER